LTREGPAGAGRVRTLGFTTLALIAFAANSVLCRLALQQHTVDAATFSSIRFASGAAVLVAIVAVRQPVRAQTGSWISAAILFLYAIPFAFAYLRLSAGTGALILFGCVQITMLVGARRMGERIRGSQALGLMLALMGLVYLVSPGLSAPSLKGAVLMATAGVAWGAYSLRGRGARDPLLQTTSNFVRTVPLVLGVSLASIPQFHIRPAGAALAVASGAIASGLGYVAWFVALRGLTAVRASVVQLAVPVLAAAGGAMFLAEPITPRLVIAALLVLGGIAMVIASRASETV
jgi:drug/metabolite transporter (DMT)-like permease